MSNKILVTDDIHPLFMERMESLGYVVDYHPEIDQQGILDIVDGYMGVVINSKTTADRQLIDSGSELRFIARMGSGMEIIDQEYAASKHIICINSPEGNRQAVAEHALGMLLSLMNNLCLADRQVRKKEWLREENRGHELCGKVVGIWGYGNTGSTFAKILAGFDVMVLAYDKYKKDFGKNYIKEASPEEIFEQADLLSIHLPLTNETKSLVNYDFLGRFRKPIYLINTARGKIVDTKDLLQALEQGKVLAAGLDVLKNEKLDTLSTEEQKWFDTLVMSSRILFTPHIAGWTYESKRKIAEVLATKIHKALSK